MGEFASFILILLCILTLSVKAKYVPVLFLFSCFLLTSAQTLVVFGFNLFPSRLLIYIMFIRTVYRGEIQHCNFGLKIDKLMIFLVFINSISGILLSCNTSEIFQRIAVSFDALGCYLLFRIYITSIDHVVFLLKAIAVLLIPVAVLMIIEKRTGINYFSLLGGISKHAVIRNGKIRAGGPFPHPIIAGTLPAVLLPQYIALLFREKTKLISSIAIFIIIVIVYSCSSSGPIMTVIFCFIGLSFWRFRKNMKGVKIAILLGLLLAEITMNSHFWYLLAKIDLTGSSTGWHRAELISQAINHFKEWWLYGTNYTIHWMPTGVGWSERHTDITNWYIDMSVKGGLSLLIIFVMIIINSFKTIGDFFRQYDHVSFSDRILVWSLGVSMFSHTITFFSITYFGQAFFIYYMQVALIAQLLILQVKLCPTNLHLEKPDYKM